MKRTLSTGCNTAFAGFILMSVGCIAVTNSTSKLKARAERGDVNAQYELALRFERGEGVEKDDAQALNWYRKAADQTNAAAQYQLGRRYEQGRGVEEDHVEALNWYRKSAEQNYPDAQFALGWDFFGRETAAADLEAVKWLRKAAEQTNAGACSLLGAMYYDGRGVEQSFAVAAKWHMQSAEINYAMARATPKATFYVEGTRDSPTKVISPVQAAKWSLQAGDESYAIASFCLGQQFRFAQGVTTNNAEAYAYFFLAAQTLEHHAKQRDTLRSMLSPDQIDAAAKRIGELQGLMDEKRQQ